jgi:DNA gyrase subunit B
LSKKKPSTNDKKASQKAKYSARNIQELDPREHIRRRPGMYVGGSDARGLHHLIYEVLDNSVESAFVDKCDSITIRLQPDNQVTISDNDTLIPERFLKGSWNQEKDMHWLDIIMTQIGSWGKFEDDGYRVSGGLHGIGLSAVNALSSSMKVVICHKNTIWKRSYQEGLPVGAMQKYTSVVEVDDGVTFTFQPDYTVFEQNDFEFDRIAKRCADATYNSPNLTIELIDERITPYHKETFFSPDGLKDLVKKLNQDKTPLHDIIHAKGEFEVVFRSGESAPYFIEFALQYTDSDETIEKSYVNTVPNTEGGTHIAGLRSAIQSSINEYFGDLYDSPRSLTWKQISQGLTMVVGIRHPDPQFESPTKVKLLTPEAHGAVKTLAYPLFDPNLTQELRQHFEAMFEAN